MRGSGEICAPLSTSTDDNVGIILQKQSGFILICDPVLSLNYRILTLAHNRTDFFCLAYETIFWLVSYLQRLTESQS
jgi:hypothetical protein